MKYEILQPAVLLLRDGTKFHGRSIGKKGTVGGEICFNTGMTGYQEIYTDPSYYGQIVVNAASHIGNYGILEKESESNGPKIQGLVVRNFSKETSRSNATDSLQAYLSANEIIGISDIDTRSLVRHIRSKGAMNAIITTSDLSETRLQETLHEIQDMAMLELSSKVSTKKSYLVGSSNTGYRIAVLDLGIKKSILHSLEQRNCCCKVFPATTSFFEIKEWDPDGYLLSNGPGDPATMDYAVTTARHILEVEKPIMGICLGYQILARTLGVSTFKMHYGHRGLNHPIKNLMTGRLEITSQNHGFAVDMNSLKKEKNVVLTHINLNDQSVEGIQIKGKPAFGIQYHPEASPGTYDATYLFDQFIQLIRNTK